MRLRRTRRNNTASRFENWKGVLDFSVHQSLQCQGTPKCSSLVKKLFDFGFFHFWTGPPPRTLSRPTKNKPSANGVGVGVPWHPQRLFAKQPLIGSEQTRGRCGNSNSLALTAPPIPQPTKTTTPIFGFLLAESAARPAPPAPYPCPPHRNCLPPATRVWRWRQQQQQRLCLCCSGIVGADEKQRDRNPTLYRTFKL